MQLTPGNMLTTSDNNPYTTTPGQCGKPGRCGLEAAYRSFGTLLMRSKAYVLCYFWGDFVCLFSKDKKLQAETSGEGTNPRWIHCFFASSPLPDVMSGSFETLLLTNLGRSLVTAVRFPHVVLVFHGFFAFWYLISEKSLARRRVAV